MRLYGKDCDSSIFKITTFWKKLTENALHLPVPRPLSQHSNTAPFVIIGDEGFALNDNLFRPYGGTHLDLLTRARRACRMRFWYPFEQMENISPAFGRKCRNSYLDSKSMHYTT